MQAIGNNFSLQQSFFDQSFDSAFHYYKLFLHCHRGGFTALAIKEAKRQIIAFEEFQFAAKQQFSESFTAAAKESRLVSIKKYHSVSCCFHFGTGVLVPDALFSAGDELKFLSFHADSVQGSELLYDELTAVGAINIYPVPSEVFETMKNTFGSFECIHLSSILIRALLSDANHNSGSTAMIYFHENTFQLLITEDRKLIFSNTFSYETCEDFLYYVLFTLEQTGNNLEKLQVSVAGQASAIFIASLKKYISSVKTAKPGTGLFTMQYSDSFADQFLLFHHLQCG